MTGRAECLYEVICFFRIHMSIYYRKEGELTPEYHEMQSVCTKMMKLAGMVSCSKLEPSMFEPLRDEMDRVRTVLKWGVNEGLLSPHTYYSIVGYPD